tara:strand:+ start:12013 stop:13389 length:1377 start_codon:yes stop_codon:yes gene_type:complete
MGLFIYHYPNLMNRILHRFSWLLLCQKSNVFLLVILATNLTISPIISAQVLSPGANKSTPSVEQAPNPEELLNIFLDCRGCREGFIKSEIIFVNFVRDMADAEVHLIITQRRTASGGSQYQISYLGNKSYVNINQDITYTSFDSDTDDEERNGLVKHIKLGLVTYLSKKDALNNFDLKYTGDLRELSSNNEDKWNNWIFEIGSNGSIDGEENQKTLVIENRVNIRHTTETWKFRLWFNNNYSRRTFTTKDSLDNNINDEFITERQYVYGQLVYSLSEHWSIGTYFGGRSSTRENINLAYGIAPTVEFSFYPYREFARREVTLRYGINPQKVFYTEKTLFGKTEETLFEQELNFNMDYTKPWGSLQTSMKGTTYLHDLSKNRLNIELELSMRIIRGLSVFVNNEYSIINNQLSLSAGGVTDKEAIANTRQQATSYSYRVRAGFEISFGSIYDSVVNTRF